MGVRKEFTYPSSDGAHQVHAVLWLPENGEPRAVVQLVHGICEYALRYEPFAQSQATTIWATALPPRARRSTVISVTGGTWSGMCGACGRRWES